MKILITGGCGFVGTNLIEAILKSKSFVTNIAAVDSLVSNTKNEKYISSDVSIFRADLSDTTQVEKYLDSNTIVVHLAALGNVVDSVANPFANFEENVKKTLILLESMRRKECNKIVFSSTGGALMGNTCPPVDETSLPAPISPYGASKLACEGYIRSYCQSYGFSSVVLRFGNVYGKYSSHKKGVINRWISLATQNQDIVIYGDGSSTRDYVHVSDICAGIVKSIHTISDSEGGNFDIFHLSSGVETSLSDLASLIVNKTNSSSNIRYKASRKGEVERNFASYSKASKVLDYSPSVSINSGLESTIQWLLHEEAQ